MKKRIFNPGFEFIFTLSILAVLGLPPLVFAQSSKDVNISITNGDTTINGRNIKELSPKEKKAALKDISSIAAIPQPPTPGMNNAPAPNMYRYHYQRKIGGDSTLNFNLRTGPNNTNDRERPMAMRKFRNDRDRDRDRNPALEFDHKNTQMFNYLTTDNNGISTHVSYRVSEPTGALNSMGTDPDNKDQHEKLDMTDLNIVPEFSAGKTVIMFNLPTKAIADVQFKDSKGNLLWSEKAANGTFMKSFPMGLNGVYYLRVEQKGHLMVKKIFKEQM
jgi:hypothetical protein